MSILPIELSDITTFENCVCDVLLSAMVNVTLPSLFSSVALGCTDIVSILAYADVAEGVAPETVIVTALELNVNDEPDESCAVR